MLNLEKHDFLGNENQYLRTLMNCKLVGYYRIEIKECCLKWDKDKYSNLYGRSWKTQHFQKKLRLQNFYAQNHEKRDFLEPEINIWVLWWNVNMYELREFKDE